jgi:esterase/lipase superfamily enzyme
VHGYNVPFDDALNRTAQLVRDLNYDSAAFLFSWPSRGTWWRYGTDRVSADAAAESLAAFISKVQSATGAEKIHIIAHSMGNRVLLPALAKIAKLADKAERPNIAEVIFAAPAVPQREFTTGVDELVEGGLRHFTLYASAVDKALLGGFFREWGAVLAGFVEAGRPLVHESVDSIDISEAGEIGLANLNHDVFASNPVMTEDMRQLLQSGRRPPDKRLPFLEPRPVGHPQFWYYSETAAELARQENHSPLAASP